MERWWEGWVEEEESEWGGELGSTKKNKEGFKFSLMEPTSNNAESKMEYYICMYFIGLFGDKMPWWKSICKKRLCYSQGCQIGILRRIAGDKWNRRS